MHISITKVFMYFIIHFLLPPELNCGLCTGAWAWKCSPVLWELNSECCSDGNLSHSGQCGRKISDLCWLEFSVRCVGCVVVSQGCTVTLVQRMVFLEEPGCSCCFRARGWLARHLRVPECLRRRWCWGHLLASVVERCAT